MLQLSTMDITRKNRRESVSKISFVSGHDFWSCRKVLKDKGL